MVFGCYVTQKVTLSEIKVFLIGRYKHLIDIKNSIPN